MANGDTQDTTPSPATYAIWTDRGGQVPVLTYVIARSTTEARSKLRQDEPQVRIVRIRRGRDVATTQTGG